MMSPLIRPHNVAIFASGSGSNAEALILKARENKVYTVVCVVCDQPKAPVIERAKLLKIPVEIIEKNKIENKKEYEDRLLKVLFQYGVQWVVLAGFMKILSQHFLGYFYDKILGQNRVINIHPSLLPLHRGLNAYERSYADKNNFAGCTVHFVDSGIDTGAIIDQKAFAKIKDEKFESFKSRGLKNENEFYPEVLEKLVMNKIKLGTFDGKK